MANKPNRKAQALSLHVGLNAVSPEAYAGWSGPLAACEFDAKDLAALATSRGIKPTVLLTKNARGGVARHARRCQNTASG
jgi:metacaspase-1